MREEPSQLELRGSEANLAQRTRERRARPAGGGPAEVRRKAARSQARPPADPAERPEVVRVEVTQRQSADPAARPVIVVQVELPPSDGQEPRPTTVRRFEAAADQRPRLALERSSRPERPGALRRAGAPADGRAPSPAWAQPAAVAVAVTGPTPRRWPRLSAHLPVTLGTACPVCGERTRRQPTPWLVRPIRWVLLGAGSWRRCPSYHWAGLALPR